MEVKLVARDGREVTARVKQPTPRVLAAVAPVYAQAEEKLLASRRGLLLVAERYGDLADELAKGQNISPQAALRVAALLRELSAEPLYELVDEYIEIAQHAVELPEGVEVDWQEQSIETLHAIFETFRRFLR
jgi:hypothetical protein